MATMKEYELSSEEGNFVHLMTLFFGDVTVRVRLKLFQDETESEKYSYRIFVVDII